MHLDGNNWGLYLFFYTLSFMTLRCTTEIHRIVGGIAARIQDYPATASMIVKFDLGHDFRGGATIIHRHWVVTAAHCAILIEKDDIKQHRAFVHSNSKHWDHRTSEHRIIKSIVHNLYSDDTGDFDIGLVKVKNSFRGKHEIPIKVASRSYKYHDGLGVIVVGWGTTLPNADPFVVNDLRSVEVNIVNADKCSQDYKEISNITHRMVCAYAKGKDACINDSGGPLYRKNVLIGIVSFGGPTCANPDYPGVYTKTSVFHHWITEKIGRLPK